MPVTTLLLDVDGVLQSGRPDLTDLMERAYGGATGTPRSRTTCSVTTATSRP